MFIDSLVEVFAKVAHLPRAVFHICGNDNEGSASVDNINQDEKTG